MGKRRLLTVFIVFILVSFAMFLVSTQVFGVPLWWVFGGLKFSIGQRPQLVVEVSPYINLNFRDTITVTVTNLSSRLPVEFAKVSIMGDGMETTLYTDSWGRIYFEYFGEDVIVIKAQKDGIASMPVTIPETPYKWVRETFWSLSIGVVSGFVASFATYTLQKRGKLKLKKREKRMNQATFQNVRLRQC